MSITAPIILSFVLTLLLIPLALRWGVRLSLVDVAEGDDLKIHDNPVPYTGGVAIALGSVISLLLLYFIQGEPFSKFLGVAGALLLLWGLGLYDDLRWKHISTIRPHLKLMLLLFVPLVAGFVLVEAGVVDSLGYLLSGLIAALVIFVAVNAVNYQDGMDGLAGGLVLLSSLGFAGLAFAAGNPLVLGMAGILVASVLAFLFVNLPPAKLFMGDSGAYFLGAYIAVLALIFSDLHAIQSVIGVIFVVGVPLFEGAFTNLRRLLAGTSILRGDRLHTYDLLLQKGYGERRVLALFYALQITSVGIGVWLLI